MQDDITTRILEVGEKLPPLYGKLSWGGPKTATYSAMLQLPKLLNQASHSESWIIRLKSKRYAPMVENLGLEATNNVQEWRCKSPHHVVALAAFAHEHALEIMVKAFPTLAVHAQRNKNDGVVPAAPALVLGEAGEFILLGSDAYAAWVCECGWVRVGSGAWYTNDPLQASALLCLADAAVEKAIQTQIPDREFLSGMLKNPLGRPWMALDARTRQATLYANQHYEGWAARHGFTKRFWHGVYISDKVAAARELRFLAEPKLRAQLDELGGPGNLIDIDSVTIGDLLTIIENKDGGGTKKKAVVAPVDRMTYNKVKAIFTTNAVKKAMEAGFTLNVDNKWTTDDLHKAIKLRRIADIEAELQIQNVLADAYAAEIATLTPPGPPSPPDGHVYDPGQIEAIAFCAIRQHTVIADDMGLGKAQPLDAKVLTPTGWRAIGELRYGDRVIGSNGRSTWVTGVFPQGKRPVFRIQTSDGATTRCCIEHLWRVNTTPGQKFTAKSHKMVMTLEDIREALASRRNEFYLPIVAPIENTERDFEVAPYLLGVILGDGLIGGRTIWVRGGDFDKLVELAPAGVTVEKNGVSGHALSSHDGRNPLKEALRKLGLGEHSSDYFIPEAYMHGSIEQRMRLLHGLCHSAGRNSKLRGMIFTSEFERLADQTAALVRSLGGTAKRLPLHEKTHPRALSDPTTKAFQIYIELPFALNPHAIDRSRAPVHGEPKRRLTGIEPDGEAECVCIKVDAEDSLYVTDDYIVTHNTQIGVGVIDTLKPPMTLIITLASNLTSWERHLNTWMRSPPAITIAKSSTIPTTPITIIANTSLALAKTILASEWDLVLIDEAHKFKNEGSQRADALYDSVDGLKAKRTIDLTGTPIPNKPQDLFNTLHQKLPQIFDSRETFMQLYGLKRVQDDTPDHAVRRQHLGLLLRRTLMLRRRKNMTVVKRRKTVVMKVDDPVLKAHLSEEMRLLFAYESSKKPTERTRILAAINEMRQKTARYKIPAVAYRLQKAAEANIPFIVFGHHTEIIDTLVRALAQLGVSTLTLHGQSSSSSGRQLLVDEFQKGIHHGVAAGIKSAGTALTITRARLVVMIELDWDPYDCIQAEDRAYRRGQQFDVDVEYYVLEGSVDGYIANVNNKKIKIATQIIDCDIKTEIDVEETFSGEMVLS